MGWSGRLLARCLVRVARGFTGWSAGMPLGQSSRGSVRKRRIQLVNWTKTMLKRAYFSARYGARVQSDAVAWNVDLDQGVVIAPVAVVSASRIGRATYVNRGAEIYQAIVGPYCSLGQYCQVGPNNHLTSHVTTSNSFLGPEGRRMLCELNSPITHIMADVWIGSRAVIMRGVEVGVGAIIGAGAVVTKPVPPYAVVRGVPARVADYRLPASDRARLLETEWWLRPIEDLRAAALLAERSPEPQRVVAFCDALAQAGADD